MSDRPAPLKAFAGYGIEMEYMIVDRETLKVLPVTDEVIRKVAGEYTSEIEQGELAWSNELVLHVIELKTNGPARMLEPLPEAFQHDVQHINRLLEPLNGRLMPGAMHPWMDPHSETRLWPHEYNAVYEAYDRIFSCQGHGWSNLQSVHINLPFADDAEFARLHAAIRAVLPILPALAASSPIADGAATGFMDTRLEAYRVNAKRIPSITGHIIPENVSGKAEYEEVILKPMFRDTAPFDPKGILRYEWLNSRGAIARFDRNAIEIRVLDIQECPQADLATAAAIVAVLKRLYEGRWASLDAQQRLRTEMLADILHATMRSAEQAVIDDRHYLELFGFPEHKCQAGELWQHLIETTLPGRPGHEPQWHDALQVILEHGPLARRILRAVGSDCRRPRLEAAYRQLCDCLAEGRQFVGLE